jgi:hypothetical protein
MREVDRDAGVASDGASMQAMDLDAEPLKGGRPGATAGDYWTSPGSSGALQALAMTFASLTSTVSRISAV